MLIGDPAYICDGLVGHALVLPEGDDFLFAHALIQEGAYSSLLRSHPKRPCISRPPTGSPAWTRPAARPASRPRRGRARRGRLSRRRDYRSAPPIALKPRCARRSAVCRSRARRAIATNSCALSASCSAISATSRASVASYRAAVGAAASDEGCAVARNSGSRKACVSMRGSTRPLMLLDRAQANGRRRTSSSPSSRVCTICAATFFFRSAISRAAGVEHELGLAYARSARARRRRRRARSAVWRMRPTRRADADSVRLLQPLCRSLPQHGFGRIEVANRSMVGFSRVYLNEPRQAREDGDAAARAAAMVGQPRAELLGETMGV